MSQATTPIVARPGPWSTSSYDALNLGVWRHTVLDASGQMVAAVYGEDDEPTARLISSAPELLAALKELRATWGRAVTAEYGADGLLLKVDALITKAEGQ